MADIAAEAHVSVKTVSRVVNHEPGVRPDTAERVRAVIERVGFRRGDSAATLRQGRTFTIGLVVEDLADPSTRTSVLQSSGRRGSTGTCS